MKFLSNLFSSKVDFLAIGDITTDIFIRLTDANVHCNINETACEICMKFADKVPFEAAYTVAGVGNSANAAVAAARLGLKSSLVVRIGDDKNGENCKSELAKNGVGTNYITVEKCKRTNLHYVLWFGAERTILIQHEAYTAGLPQLPNDNSAPRWIYLSSVGGDAEKYQHEIMRYLGRNPRIKLAFQPGTFQMKQGIEKNKYLYERSEVFIVNVEESQRILNTTEYDKKKLMRMIARLGPKIVCITDGPKGAYMLDTRANNGEGETYYMPIYPDPKDPYERTGCGDAFASTFVSALILGLDPVNALTWAPINSMSVVQQIGAQKGLLTREQLENFLAKRPENYKPQKI